MTFYESLISVVFYVALILAVLLFLREASKSAEKRDQKWWSQAFGETTLNKLNGLLSEDCPASLKERKDDKNYFGYVFVCRGIEKGVRVPREVSRDMMYDISVAHARKLSEFFIEKIENGGGVK